MIAIIPERVIGMPRNTDRHRPESPMGLPVRLLSQEFILNNEQLTLEEFVCRAVETVDAALVTCITWPPAEEAKSAVWSDC